MSIAKEKVDWKKIRDDFNALANPNSPDVSKYAAMEYAAESFNSLITALEEQEKALEQAIKCGHLQLVEYPDGMYIYPHLFSTKDNHELAKYLEEKNV